jgi:serine-type D-Ala-D-Ala carboxypeptidase/endopeptidase
MIEPPVTSCRRFFNPTLSLTILFMNHTMTSIKYDFMSLYAHHACRVKQHYCREGMMQISFSKKWIIGRSISIALLVSSLFILPGIRPVYADPLLDEIVQFSGEIFGAENNVPALIIAVVHKDRISIRGFGERSGKGSKPPDGTTILRIGSIIKAFDGEVLAHLAARNIVQLTDPVTRTWPELAANAKANVAQVRFIDLVTHSAGLPRELPNDLESQGPVTIDAYTTWFKKNNLLFEPGRSIHYSNVGYDLLAVGLSRAANKPFASLLQHYVTGPLGMKDTVFLLSPEQKQRLMQGHDPGGAPIPDSAPPPVNYGAGALYSTADDLVKWMRWHLDRFGRKDAEARLLSHALYLPHDGLQLVSGFNESGPMDAMGLGWVAMMPSGNRPYILQKSGALQGTISYIAFSPARDVAVFIAINKFDFRAAAAMIKLANNLITTLAQR